MERASVEDDNRDQQHLSSGLGTPATRAGIIESLVKDGYVIRAKNNIIPTETGTFITQVVPASLKSPLITAQWEEKLKDVENGALTYKEFMGGINNMISSLVSEYSTKSAQSGQSGLSPFKHEYEVLGKCPRCGNDIVFGVKHKNYYCRNKDCGFSLWENNRLFESMGKKLTKTMVKGLLCDGQVLVKGLKSKRTGNTFDAYFVLNDTGGKYVNFDMKFK